MKARKKNLGIFFSLLLAGSWGQVQALEILHFIEAGSYARVMQDASGIKISDDGVVYVTSEEQGTLLKIVDGNIEATSLSPSVFKESDLGGIDLLPNGDIVIVNRGSSQVGVLDMGLQLKTLFSQSGSSPGELNAPQAVAVSVNRNIYVGDVKGKQIKTDRAELEAAVKSFDGFLQEVAQSPLRPNAIFGKSISLAGLGEKQQALVAMRQFVEENPNHPLVTDAQRVIDELS